MQEMVHNKSKVYYSMGEVAEMFDVNPSLLRYWEKEFDVLKPHRNKKGNRLFTPQDVDNLKIIYHLLREKKMKIEVARKYLKDNKNEAGRDAVIVERLMSIRSMLLQIKQDMLHGAADEDDDEGLQEELPTSAVAGKRAGSAVRIEPAPVVGDERETVVSDERETAETEVVEYGAPILAVEEELTVSEIISEEAAAEKLPFKEQMLFEVGTLEIETPTLDSMINSFLSKNFAPEHDDMQAPEHDPFAAFSDTGNVADGVEREAKLRPTIIEQTLF